MRPARGWPGELPYVPRLLDRKLPRRAARRRQFLAITTPVKGKKRRPGAKPVKARGVAKRPVARKSRKTEGTKVHDFEMRLAEVLKREAEVLEQQTATAEILRVISASPMNLQPVLDTVVQSAGRFCGANDAAIFLVDGGSFK